MASRRLGLYVLILLCLVVLLSLSVSGHWLSNFLGRLRPGGGRGKRRQVQMSSRKFEEGETGIGLRNLGNTCYMNSVLQGLYHVKPFREAVLKERFVDKSFGHEMQRVFEFMNAKIRSREEEGRKGRAVAGAGRGAVHEYTHKLAKALGVNVHTQEDAQEFFLSVMDKLDSSLVGPSNTKKKNERGKEETSDGSPSPSISQVFQGFTEQVISCNSLAYERRKLQRFLDLSLEPSASLDDSMARLFNSKEVIEGYKVPASVSTSPQEASKYLQLVRDKMPAALCVHLKRFSFDGETSIMAKLSSRMEFPLSLDLSAHAAIAGGEGATAEVKDVVKEGEVKDLYVLSSVVVHDGNAQQGHYFCYARPDPHALPNKWLRLNDHFVDAVDLDEVFSKSFGGSEKWGGMGGGGGGLGGAGSGGASSCTAYLLFYVRKTDTNT